METNRKQSTLFDPLPALGAPLVTGSLYVCLYENMDLSVIASNPSGATRQIRFDQVYRGPAPADINRELPCVLWLAAQMYDDAFHAPF